VTTSTAHRLDLALEMDFLGSVERSLVVVAELSIITVAPSVNLST